MENQKYKQHENQWAAMKSIVTWFEMLILIYQSRQSRSRISRKGLWNLLVEDHPWLKMQVPIRQTAKVKGLLKSRTKSDLWGFLGLSSPEGLVVALEQTAESSLERNNYPFPPRQTLVWFHQACTGPFGAIAFWEHTCNSLRSRASMKQSHPFFSLGFKWIGKCSRPKNDGKSKCSQN